jgi:hypothetical protein
LARTSLALAATRAEERQKKGKRKGAKERGHSTFLPADTTLIHYTPRGVGGMWTLAHQRTTLAPLAPLRGVGPGVRGCCWGDLPIPATAIRQHCLPLRSPSAHPRVMRPTCQTIAPVVISLREMVMRFAPRWNVLLVGRRRLPSRGARGLQKFKFSPSADPYEVKHWKAYYPTKSGIGAGSSPSSFVKCHYRQVSADWSRTRRVRTMLKAEHDHRR